MPVMVQNSIAPFQAQKRAENLGIAESTAVTYSAANKGRTTLTEVPNDCERDDLGNGAFKISRKAGEGTR